MGLAHHKQQIGSTGSGIFAYSAGWRWKGTDNKMYCSVMTYEGGSNFPDGITSTRVPYFSNPSISYMGYPTGHATEADAARHIREMKHIIAAYRTRPAGCNPPRGFMASAFDQNYATIGWHGESGIKGFSVEYKVSTASSWTALEVSPSSENSHHSWGFETAPSTTYNCRVKTICKDGSSSAYSEISITTPPAPACFGSYEPNETTATAHPIANQGTYYGCIEKTGDKDYYKFTLKNKCDVFITLKSANGNCNLTLYNSSGQVYSISLGTTQRNIGIGNVEPGTYYILVDGSPDRSQCYELDMEARATEIYYYEPNETRATAYQINTEETYRALIESSTDKDYYKFNISSPSNVTVTLQNLPKNYDLKVYNSSGTQIGSSTNSGTTNETVNLSNLAAGTYYAYVYGYGNCYDMEAAYSLKVTTSGIAGKKNFEPNEAIATAYPIQMNTIYYASIETSTDKDYYKFTLPYHNMVTITLQDLTKDYDLKLYNSSGVQIGNSSNGGTTSEIIATDYLDPGTYYIYVYGYGGNYDPNNCYTLIPKISSMPFDPVGIEETNTDKETVIVLFPNPVENILNIKGIGYEQKDIQFTIADIAGKTVKTGIIQADGNIAIDVSDIPSNVYFLIISGKTYRFIKK